VDEAQELPDNAAEGDEDGFKNEGEGKTAEGADVDFVSVGAGVRLGSDETITGEVLKVDRYFDGMGSHKKSPRRNGIDQGRPLLKKMREKASG
jgi:hypothetical protein